MSQSLAPKPAPPDEGSNRERVLLVDDSPALLAVLERSLAARYDVTTACDGVGGLEQLERNGPFAVVVSDYEMPGMDGTEFLSRVHAIAPDTVGILLTGLVSVEVAIRALHCGRVMRLLEKPCPREQIFLAVQQAIEEHHRCKRAREHEGALEHSRDALWEFNAALTSRIREQTLALERINRFVGELNGAESLEDIASLAANALSALLRGRSVEVHLGRDLAGLHAVATCGGVLSSSRHLEEITAQGGSLGRFVIESDDGDGRGLSDGQRDVLRAVASATAVASRNVVRRIERDEAQQATILALARLAEQRDNETGKHLERVSLYCRLIAEGLREDGHGGGLITDAWIHDLVRSAPLHDIGKVGIPDAILLKPGELTRGEWEIMRRHTEIGAATLQGVISENRNQSFLQMSLDIAWCHHEKWDGSGYPRALSGETIPLSARVLALADVYDALTSVRPYKSAWSHADAIRWIEGQRGTHFDPRVADAFLSRADRADFIRARLADSGEDVAARHRAFGVAV